MTKEFGTDFIRELGDDLLEYGFQVQRLEDEEDENEPDTLRCGVVLESGIPLLMDINFYQVDTYSVLQIYAYIRGEVDEKEKIRIAPMLEECNCFSPIGHFGYYENGLYYRYGMAFEEDETVKSAVDRSETALELLISTIDINLRKMGFADEKR